jgi:hypothetical protein
METSDHFKNGAIPKSQTSRKTNFKKMKKVLFIATIFSVFVVLTAFTTSKNYLPKTETAIASDYCDGWEDGYCEGWKDVKGPYAICPITPICPIPEFGKDRYRDGYNRGFKAGSRAAQK